jgi:hypothetical protein
MRMTKSEFSAGLIAMTVDVALMMGGSKLSLVTVISKFPRMFLIPGVGQIVLGLACVAGDILLCRRNTVAKYVLLLVGTGVVINTIVYLWMGISESRSRHNGHQQTAWPTSAVESEIAARSRFGRRLPSTFERELSSNSSVVPTGTHPLSIVAVPTTGSGGLLSVVPAGTKTIQRRILQIESKLPAC